MKRFLTLSAFLLLSVASFAYYAYIDGIYYDISETEATVTKHTNGEYSGTVIIPESVIYYGKTYSVTSIGEWAFAYCRNLASVTISNSVINIDKGAFFGCSSLTSMKIPDSVKSIEKTAFYGCYSLTSLTIGNSVTSIGDEAFGWCVDLTSVTIPNSVDSIDDGAFSDCSSLTSVMIGSGVTSIGTNPFYNCSNLTSITVENGNTVYDSRNNCNAVIKTAENELISGCKNTVIPDNVTSIGEKAFYGCVGLTSVAIPSGVTSIGDYAFYQCSNLTSVTIPNGVTIINNSTFSGCTALTSVTIPNSVTRIGYMAFDGCICLTSVTLPNSVTGIGGFAFKNCQSLMEIISQIKEPFPTTTDIRRRCWSGVDMNIPLYVPVGTKELYAVTEGWSQFTNIIERGLTPVERDESVTYSDNTEINGSTDLGSAVIGDIYYNIPISTGGYDAANGCITVETAIADEQVADIAGKDVYDADVAANFNGIVFLLPAGSGTLTVNAETVGNMTLKLKVGDDEPIAKQLNGKQEVTIPYNTPVSTYVYIYAGQSVGAKGVRQAAASNALRIYGIALNKDEATGIKDITVDEELRATRTTHGIYTLQGVKVSDDADALKQLPRGIYIVNGKKIAVK